MTLYNTIGITTALIGDLTTSWDADAGQWDVILDTFDLDDSSTGTLTNSNVTMSYVTPASMGDPAIYNDGLWRQTIPEGVAGYRVTGINVKYDGVSHVERSGIVADFPFGGEFIITEFKISYDNGSHSVE